MIKLFAKLTDIQYVSPSFRFYMHNDSGNETNALFCLMSKELIRDSTGKDFFHKGYIIKYIKDLGLKCEIECNIENVKNLNDFLSEHGIFYGSDTDPKKLFTFKF